MQIIVRAMADSKMAVSKESDLMDVLGSGEPHTVHCKTTKVAGDFRVDLTKLRYLDVVISCL